MKITYYGHGCFQVATVASTLLIDPFISANPLASHINIDQIQCTHILLTHGHVDHVLDVERIQKNTTAQLIANWEIVKWFEKKKIQGISMNQGGWFSTKDCRIKYVAAVHSSGLPDGSYGGNPGGFIIESQDRTLYLSGDTALTYDMKLIPLLCRPLDAAILCIGDHFTMGVSDAIIASDFIGCNMIIGAHYDTFDPIKIDHQKAKSAFAKKNKTLNLLDIGASMEL